MILQTKKEGPMETITLNDEPLTITLNDDEQKAEVEIIEVKTKSWRSKARKISSSHFYNVTLNPSLPLGKGEKQLSKPNIQNPKTQHPN